MDWTTCNKARKGGQKAKFECCIKLSGIRDAFIAVLTAFWFFTACASLLPVVILLPGHRVPQTQQESTC